MNEKEKLISKAENAHVIGGALLFFWAITKLPEFIYCLLSIFGTFASGYMLETIQIESLLSTISYPIILAVALVFVISKRSNILGFIFMILSLAFPILLISELNGIEDLYDILVLIISTATALLITFTAVSILLSIIFQHKRLTILNFGFILPCIYIVTIIICLCIISVKNTSQGQYITDIWPTIYSFISQLFPWAIFGVGIGMIMQGANLQNKMNSYIDHSPGYTNPEMNMPKQQYNYGQIGGM